MKTLRWSVLAAIVGLMSAPVSAEAQDTPSWTSQEANGVRLAYAVFPQGVALITRCQEGVLEVLVQGIQLSRPDIEGAARFGEGRIRPVSWSRSQDGRYLIADRPAHLIRGLAQNRTATLQFGFGEAAASMQLETPQDAAPLTALLQACAQPLTSARDEAEPIALTAENLLNPGRVRVPPRAAQDNVSGWARVSCMTAENNRLVDCETEAEGPVGYGFGRASVASLQEARLRETVPPGRLVTIRLTTIVE